MRFSLRISFLFYFFFIVVNFLLTLSTYFYFTLNIFHMLILAWEVYEDELTS